MMSRVLHKFIDQIFTRTIIGGKPVFRTVSVHSNEYNKVKDRGEMSHDQAHVQLSFRVD